MKKRKLLVLMAMAVSSWSYGQYCSGGPTSTGYSNVESLDLIGDNSTISYTGCPGILGLEDQTSNYADVTANNQYTVDVVFGTCSFYYTGAGTVWIDWNGNQTFETSEVIGTFSGGTPNTSNFTFTVPATAVNGLQRMRVKHQEFGSLPQSPCGTFTWGSLTDFGIVVTGGTGCGSPYNLAVTASSSSSIDLSWSDFSTPSGGYLVEYGAPGFAQGTGTEVSVTGTSTSIGSLPSNSFYEFYVRGICGVGDTSVYQGPAVGNTYGVGQFIDWDVECPTGGFVDISSTGTDLGLTDDGEVGLTLPFPILYQGQLMQDVTIGNNGGLQLGTQGAGIGYGGNFNSMADGTIFPWGDDLDQETGNVYWEAIGTAPNRVFIVHWHNICNYPGAVGGPTVDFQVQFEEATQEIYFVYNDVVFGGSNSGDDYADNASIGVSGAQDITVSQDDPNFLMNNSCAHFFYTNCPNVMDLQVITYDYDQIGLSWNAGLAQESDWIIEYGTAGFTPGGAGSLGTINTSNTYDTITGLDQITDYDIYVYANCDPSAPLTSSGMLVQHQTAPLCANPFGITVDAAVDSLMPGWNWQSNGSGLLPVNFNVAYVPSGQDIYADGTIFSTNQANFADTIEDQTLIASGVYDVYVQTECNSGDTSLFVGPVNFLAFLDNDSSCYAQELDVDGSTYVLYNNGAQLDPGVQSIAPSATGYNTTDGWGTATMYRTTWYSFVAPASGDMMISGTDLNYDAKMAVYSTTSCGDYSQFNLMGANDNGVLFGSTTAPEWAICGLTPGETYYLLHSAGSNWTAAGTYTIRLEELAFDAGSSNGIIDACIGDTVDLFTTISSYDVQYGAWIDLPNTSQIVNDTTFATSVLASQVYDFEYRVQLGCSFDSIVGQVEIYPLSSAGNDGNVDVCLNEPINLYSGLTGSVNLNGTWYDPQDAIVSSNIPSAGNVPGQYNYDYVAGNGVCPDDTALMVVNVQGNCDYLGLDEFKIEGLNVYPNPANDVLNIASKGEHNALSINLIDVNGRVVLASSEKLEAGSNVTIDISTLSKGVYMLKLNNNNVKNTFRVVVQ